MDIVINDEFKSICKRILKENKSDDEWAEIESDDMFQTKSFCGGYDADEEAFCFSYYDKNGEEFWFQLSLEEVRKIMTGTLTRLQVRPAE